MTSNHDSRAGRRRRNSIAGKFTALLNEILESTPWRALNLADRRVLDRICLELSYQGGRQKDGLCVTFDDFTNYGVRRHNIASSVRVVVALGFVHIVRQGRGGNREYRLSSIYQLTFVNSTDDEPLHQWKRFRHKSLQECKAIAAKARAEKTFSSDGIDTESSDGSVTENRAVSSDGSVTTIPVSKASLLSISARGGRSGGGGGSVCLPSGHAGRSAGAGPGHGHATGPKPATATVTKTKPKTVSAPARPTTVNRPIASKVASSVTSSARPGPQLVRRRIGTAQHDEVEMDEIEMKFYPGDID